MHLGGIHFIRCININHDIHFRSADVPVYAHRQVVHRLYKLNALYTEKMLANIFTSMK